MATYFVSEAGSNTSPYDTWTKSATTLATAIAAATASGDVILIDKDHTGDNASTVDFTLAIGNNIALICVDKDNSDALAEMGAAAWIGSTASAVGVFLTGAYRVFMRGITFRTNGSSSGDHLAVAGSDGAHWRLENCYLWHGSTSTLTRIRLGVEGVSSTQAFLSMRGCTFRFGSTAQSLAIRSHCEMFGCTISGSGSTPTTLFEVANAGYPGGAFLSASGCDLSLVTGTLFGSSSSLAATARLANCKLGGGVAVLGTQTPANKSSLTVETFNCASGDQHYHMGHYDAMGSTIVDTGIYANDGAQYDGTNRCSWKIASTANCSFYTPYVSPWFSVYHAGTSAITPYVEILRDGSTTAYQNDEVWLELSYQGTSGSPLASMVDDRMLPLGTPANQDAGVGTAGWTGDSGAWSGKIGPASSITPAEIGHLMARVCVGEPSITVYVDPTIRGRS